MKLTKWIFFASLLTVVLSCGDDEIDTVVTANDFSISVVENITSGSTIGTVSATTTNGTLAITLSNQVPSGAMTIDNDGVLKVEDASAFDFETNTQITAEYTATADGISDKGDITITITDVDEGGGGPTFNIWTGSTITFTKEDETDPTQEANQDKLTDLVIITRNNEEGGQIYNIVSETEPVKETSPAGTEWAEGTTADIATLTFTAFRTAVDKPKDAVGKSYVVHLIEDDVYLDLKITSWSEGKKGGFAYERSTPQ